MRSMTEKTQSIGMGGVWELKRSAERGKCGFTSLSGLKVFVFQSIPALQGGEEPESHHFTPASQESILLTRYPNAHLPLMVMFQAQGQTKTAERTKTSKVTETFIWIDLQLSTAQETKGKLWLL